MSEQPLMRVTENSVVIDHGAYTTVDIRDSHFTRWSDGQIARYEASLLRWQRFGWLRGLGKPGHWAADRLKTPQTKPRDRHLLITNCVFEGQA